MNWELAQEHTDEEDLSIDSFSEWVMRQPLIMIK